jgi:hypothetical protein
MVVTSMWNRRGARDDVIVKEERHRRMSNGLMTTNELRPASKDTYCASACTKPTAVSTTLGWKRVAFGREVSSISNRWRSLEAGGDGKESEVQFVEVLYAHGDFKPTFSVETGPMKLRI